MASNSCACLQNTSSSYPKETDYVLARPLLSRLAAHETTHKQKNPEEEKKHDRDEDDEDDTGNDNNKKNKRSQCGVLRGFQIVHPSFHLGSPPPRAGNLPVPPQSTKDWDPRLR
jgi:hypothetical protein